MDESTARSRHPDSMGQAFLWALFPTLVLFLIAPPVGDAQEVTTNITSSGLGTVVPLQPPSDGVYNITGGTRPGDGPNLFHSFGDFSVGSGDIANFLNNTNIQTSNIIGRVTELGLAHTSYIYGTIQTTDFGNANLFLVNPSGFVFGPHGSVSVNGSVSFTTAQYLRLSDGVNSANFYANPASDGNSILVVDPVVNFGFVSLATPAAYGFLTPPDPSATITVQGSALSVPPGQSISLVGGQVVIQGDRLPDGTVQAAQLSASNGTIQLASTASPGEFDVAMLQSLPNVDGASFTSFGSVSLAPGSSIDVSGASTVFIKGGQIVLSMNDAVLSTSQTPSSPETISLSPGSSIVTSNSGTDPGADVQLIASNVQMDGALILSVTTGGGPGGNLTIQGRTETDSATDYSVTLSNGAAIITETDVAGHGGDILVTGSTLLDAGSVLVTVTSGTDGGGNISLDGRTLTLANGSGILSQSSGLGHGGSVTIQGLQGEDYVAESVALSGDSFLLSQAGSGSGEGGLVTVVASSVALDGAFTTINSSTSADALGGAIVVGVQHLTLSGGATITSSTGGADPAAVGGNVTVQGLQEGSKAESLTLSGQGSGIISETLGKALPGNIAVLASALNLTDGAVIQAGTLQTVSGGDVTVDADSVGISGGSRISSQAFTTNAGQVSITANTLILDNGSIITETRSADGGRGGNVVLNVGSVSLTNGAKINSSTLNTGQAGDITMKVGTLTLTNNAEISSNSRATASGDAGTVTIGGQGGLGTSATSVALDNSSMLTTTEGTGAGGDIQIHAGQVQLADLALLTAATSGTGKAGSIEVTSDNLNITGGARIEASTSSVGNAGDITITNNDTVTVAGLSSDGSTRSGIFAKTQSSGGITGAGGGGGSGGGGSSQTSTAGDAGNIDLTTKNFFLSGGAQTDSSTTTSGSGGHVSVIADAITITGTSTSLRSDASRGNGKGGDIELVARTIGIHDKASVTAATDGSGNAGNISMKANESFTLDSAAIITSSTRGSGDGGTISIDSPKVLVDGPGTSITASTLRPFADLAVTLNIVHPNDGDLTVRLDSPDGTRVALISRVGGSSDNFTGTILDDLATRPIPTTSTSAPFTGTFMPREPLGQLIDQTVAGTWKLNINDQVAGNAGVPQNLTGWSLRVGDHVFESSNVPRNIPDGGSVSSSLVVTVPAGTVVQGVGEATGSGGNVTIKADMLTVQNGATLSATTRGSGQGGTVSVDARGGLVTLAGPGTGLFTNSEASGRSGDINVNASHMTMDNGAEVSAASSGTGDAGSIIIAAPDNAVSLASGSSITSSTTGAGNAGQVIVTTPTLNLDNASLVTSTSSSGNAGSITANVGTLSLTGGAQITSASTGTASGSAGSVTIQGLASPADAVTLTNSSLRTSADSTGRGGSIIVDATNLTLNGATISASVKDVNAADVTVGNIALTSSTMHMTGGTITAATTGTRNAGTILMTTTDDMLNVGGGGSITSSTTGAGNAGQVIVTTPTLNLDNASLVTSTSSSGNAGSITANVGTLSLTGGAQITSASTGTASGSAGSVTIQGLASPADAVTLTNSSLRTSADSTGRGGSIIVDATNLTLNGATISASVKDVNAADVTVGNIALTSSTMHMTGGTITAATTGTRNAGTILMTTTDDMLNVGGGGSITSSTTGAGNAGQVIVTTPTLNLDNASLVTSTSSSGNAGSITANVGTLSLTGGAQITSASTGTASGSAGSVTIQGLASPADAVTLTNSSLRTSADSTGRGGSIIVDATNLTLNGATISASVKDVNAADVTVGNIALTSSTMHMTGGTITAATTGTRNAGTILMTTTDDMLNVGGGGSITSSTTGAGNAGQVIIITPALSLNDATITTSTSSTGNAGSITANVGTLSLTGGAQITSASTGTASGSAGSVTIQGLASPADAVTLTNSSLRTSADSTGRGGSIIVDATNLTLNGATISASVNNFDNSPGSTDGPTSGLGDIKVTSSTMNMTGGTVTAATSGARNAGTITLTTTDKTGDTLNVGGGGSITSSTTGAGKAGQVIVTTPALNVDNATITTSTSGTGIAGDITANVGTLTLTNAAEISSSSTGTASGNAGSITIQGLVSPANAVTLTDSSLRTSADSTGRGGDISVSGLAVTLNNATISATANAGNAGSVTIKDANTVQSTSGSVTTESTTGAGGSITIDAVNSINLSGTTISAKVTSGTEDGGNITVSAGQQVTMEDGTIVSAQSLSTDEKAGDAGTVTVKAGNQFLMNNSTITTESTKAGGGRVEIDVADGFMVRLINSGIKTSVFGGSDTKGGNINIDPQFVILQNSQILAQAFAGAGGAITITATSAYIADSLSIVDASSTLGINGPVNILAPLQNVGAELTALTQEFSSAAALLAQQCAARAADGKFSTFVVAAREGLPGEPGGFLVSPSLTTAELLGSRLSGRDPQTQLSTVTGLFPKYDARPIQLARFGEACHRQ